ncbi:unnamed protein product [marine sediment metagenome]|uniref:Uncharacterized protein n=1 Tax=marine sediment metagenome TaxID=412755 RepID=X1D4Q2_9ZZZZ
MKERSIKFKFEYLIVPILIILSFNVYINHEKIKLAYDFSSDQIDTIFFIQENIPENSKIIVPDLKYQNYVYDLLIGYECEKLDNSKKYFYVNTKGMMYSTSTRYLVVDISIIDKNDLNQFRDDENFEILYENDLNIVFKYNFASL